VDVLKIDRSFVSGVGSDLSATLVVHSVIELAHRMGMQAVAEGVETEEQFAYMKEKGCDAVQGYLLGRPMPAEDFAELLRKGTAGLPRVAAP
jgi:EAL domain-containing protein (putative c-di-GMP-specific phosphodiesterase class I)